MRGHDLDLPDELFLVNQPAPIESGQDLAKLDSESRRPSFADQSSHTGLSISEPRRDDAPIQPYERPVLAGESLPRIAKVGAKIATVVGVFVWAAGVNNVSDVGQAALGKVGFDTTVQSEAQVQQPEQQFTPDKPPKQKPQIITITPSPSPTEAALTEPEPSAEQQPPALKYLLNTIVFEGNALGHSHTAPGGKAEQMAGSQERTKKLVKLIKKLNVGVGGLQEFQQPQHDAFDKLAGDDYGLWPNKSEDVVFWDKAQFEKIGEDTFNAPYFDGNTRQYPIVKLQDKTTGQKFFAISVHWPADTRQFTDQERFREQAANRLITVIVRLSKSGLPVIVVGDLNERKDGDGFCDVDVPGTGIESANGGSNIGGNCKEPTKKIAVDWIFGTSDIDYSDYEPHAKPAMTDHRNVFSARVTLANTTR